MADQEWQELGDEVQENGQYPTEGDKPQDEYAELEGDVEAAPINDYEEQEPALHAVEHDGEYPDAGGEAEISNQEGDYVPEEAPADEAPAGENPEDPQWDEVGDGHVEEQAQQDQYAELDEPQQQPQGQRARALVKPKNKTRAISRWEPEEYDPRDDSEDEFELSTCMRPVYDEEDVDEDAILAEMKNGKPDCEGEIVSCFDEPNMLYRIVNKADKTWAFYNDSLDYEMHIRFNFGKHSKIQPLDDTTMERNDAGEYVTQVVVYPTETEMFIQGDVNGFTSKLRAVPLSEDYHRARNEAIKETLEQEREAVRQLVGDNATSEEAVQACVENGIPFVDPEFPPCQESLEAGGTKAFKPLAWARPKMYLPAEMENQIRLFRAPIVPGKVAAGDLGDVWVMCSVCSVSEDPARLRGMFRHPEGKAGAQREHAVGAYRVTFNKDGWWKSVVVDDYLPVSAGMPRYARSANSPAEIWPCILQKAFAKLHGSYAKICTGDPLHSLQDMTGFSTYRFDESLEKAAVQDDDTLFRDLQAAVRGGYTIIFSTPGKGQTPNSNRDGSADEIAAQYKSVGLLPGHAYTILDAKHFPDVDDLRILKVRNAWGYGLEWSGDWGDNDPKWQEYPEVAEECNFQKAADGIFWMTFADAMKYFNGGGICFSHQPAYDYRLNCLFMDGVPSTVLQVEVREPTWMTVVISQEDKRNRESGAEYQPVMVSVAQPIEGGNYKVFLNSTATGIRPSTEKWTFLQSRDVSLVYKFEPGNYIIVPRVMYGEGSPADVPFTLGVITNSAVGGDAISIDCKRLPPDSRVFENFPKFEPELLPVEQEVQFQKRAPGAGFPVTQETDGPLQ